MQVTFNCCPKPALFTHNSSKTLFRGDSAPAEKKQPQPTDTFEKKTETKSEPTSDVKKPEPEPKKCEGPDCKK